MELKEAILCIENLIKCKKCEMRGCDYNCPIQYDVEECIEATETILADLKGENNGTHNDFIE